MDIDQEKWDYTAMLVAENAITQEQCDTLKLTDGMNMFYSDHLAPTTIDCINWGWSSWLKAKAQAVPEGFVLVPKEPTDEMLIAADNCEIDGKVTAHNIYKAMLEVQELK